MYLKSIDITFKKLPLVTSKKNYVVVASRSHMSTETHQHIEQLKLKYGNVEIVNTGSSIKLCLVAEGVADEYPRYGPTMEWDTAAGQAILQEANCSVIDFETNTSMRYNRENLLNHWFIAKRKLDYEFIIFSISALISSALNTTIACEPSLIR